MTNVIPMPDLAESRALAATFADQTSTIWRLPPEPRAFERTIPEPRIAPELASMGFLSKDTALKLLGAAGSIRRMG